jgi:hypothetical protein
MRKSVGLMAVCFLMLITAISAFSQSRQTKPAPTDPQIISQAPTPTPRSQQRGASERAADAELLLKIKTTEAESALYTIDPDKYKDKAYAPARLAQLYQQAIDRPYVLQALAGEVYAEFIANKSGARGAAQVSQLADEAGMKIQMVIIAQNQRIIELLEQLVQKR